MRRSVSILALLLMLLPALAVQAAPPVAAAPDPDRTLLELPAPPAKMTAAQWSAFSRNLRIALASDNDGLQAGAMQMIVTYRERLDVRDAAFDVVRIFQDHKDERMRRMAVVTCGHLGSRWALGFLRMSEPFEQSPVVRATIRSVLAEQVG